MNGNEGSGGSGEKFGAPPPPKLEVRTMGTDLSSIQKGEPAPVPESVFPPSGGGKESVFRPETQFDASFSGGVEEIPSQKKRVWLWVWVGIAVVAVAGIGYIVYPFISSSEEPPPPPPPPPALVPPPPQAPALEHQSFFVTAPPAGGSVGVLELTPVGVTDALRLFSTALPLPSGTVQEAVMNNVSAGGFIPFSTFMAIFIPEFGAGGEATAWFEDDFTAFLYYDRNGVWPGYIGKVKNGVNLDEVKTKIQGIVEGRITDLDKFYLSPPGTFASFKNGQHAARYAVGGVPGAAFNYGIFESYLILSSSYGGLTAVFPLLGL